MNPHGNGLVMMINTRIRQNSASSGKTYQDIRLNADGIITRPDRNARSSNGAPMRAIPSNVLKQEKRTNARAMAI